MQLAFTPAGLQKVECQDDARPSLNHAKAFLLLVRIFASGVLHVSFRIVHMGRGAFSMFAIFSYVPGTRYLYFSNFSLRTTSAFFLGQFLVPLNATLTAHKRLRATSKHASTTSYQHEHRAGWWVEEILSCTFSLFHMNFGSLSPSGSRVAHSRNIKKILA